MILRKCPNVAVYLKTTPQFILQILDVQHSQNHNSS